VDYQFHDTRVAIAKGRILEQVVPRWREAQLPWPLAAQSRQLWFSGSDEGPGAMIVRGPDVPTLVARGAADLGIVGSDLLVERGMQNVLQVGDLDLALCRVVLAGIRDTLPDGPFQVASKYQTITRDYLASRHFQADIVPLSGSLELAPLIGLAPYIVDIVETGETLRQHHLVELETIMHSHACLIANPAHWRAKPEVVLIRDRLMRHMG
jgi:ATP phosphoribosyltransferase